MKFVILFLIFALATIQGFRTVDAQSTDNHLHDFLSTSKTLVEKYKILLYVVGDHLPKFLKDVQETIIAEHIPELLDSFYENAEKLVIDNIHCFEDNKFNPMEQYKCLIEHIKSSEEESAMEELKEEMRSFVVVAKELAMNVSQAIDVDGDI